MVENLLDGAEIFLSADPFLWEAISARWIVYTGRPDLIRIPGASETFAERHKLGLDYRMLDVGFAAGPWPHQTAILNNCTRTGRFLRRTCYARLTGGASRLISSECPRAATLDDIAPSHPFPSLENEHKVMSLQEIIRRAYPNLRFAGRLGTCRYLDMDQAVQAAWSIDLPNRPTG